MDSFESALDPTIKSLTDCIAQTDNRSQTVTIPMKDAVDAVDYLRLYKRCLLKQINDHKLEMARLHFETQQLEQQKYFNQMMQKYEI